MGEDWVGGLGQGGGVASIRSGLSRLELAVVDAERVALDEERLVLGDFPLEVARGGRVMSG